MSALQREPITEQAAAFLAEAIIDGRLAGGDHVPEQPWAERLGVSRGSLRESLLILERRHLVRLEPRRGAYVVPLDRAWAKDVAAAWFLLIGAVVAAVFDRRPQTTERRLEVAAVRLRAMRELDELADFEAGAMTLVREVGQASGNRVFAAMLRNLEPAVRRCFRVMLASLPATADDTLALLVDLRRSFAANDRDAAVAALDTFAATQTDRLMTAIFETRPAPEA